MSRKKWSEIAIDKLDNESEFKEKEDGMKSRAFPSMWVGIFTCW